MSHVTFAWIASALAFAVSMSLSPGPNNAMLAASGASYGFRRTLPHMAGVSLGFPVMLVAVAFGIDRVFAAVPLLARAMTALGVAYLLFLAWKIGSAPPREVAGPDAAAPRGTPLGFLQAVLFQWVNPKAWIVSLGAIALYTRPGPHKLADALALAATFLSVTPFVVAFWTGLGIGAARMLRSARAQRGFNVAMAVLLVGSLVPLLFGG